MPAKIDPAAIPEVMVEEIPANRSATAKITAALLPSNGVSSELACSNSVTGVPLRKNVAAASSIIALLIAQPMTMESIVSAYS